MLPNKKLKISIVKPSERLIKTNPIAFPRNAMSFEVLTYGFMQRAIISGIAIAILCSVVGLFLVYLQELLQ